LGSDQLSARAEAYRRMNIIRRFEERALDLGSEGLIQGSIHLCLGQEAIPVGAVEALGEADRVLATYRGHGWAIACGVPLDSLLGELCQRAEGINGGRGGSPHFFAPRWRMLGENSIVGAGVPIAAGVAMAASLQGDGRVVVTSIGDGAMSQGAVHEGLVFAAARALPLIVLIESNEWAEMTRTSTLLRIDALVERAAGYGISGVAIDGTDPIAVRDAVAEAARTARAGSGPVLIEAATLRLSGHYNRDIEHYRPKAEREAALRQDPLARLRQGLLDAGEVDAETLDALDAEVEQAVDQATVTVRQMAAPDPATARDHVYAPGEPARAIGPEETPRGEVQTYVKAVTAALHDALSEDERVLVYGEDVGYAGGIFGASRGLQEEFGADRVFDTPIAEAAILGSAIGAAMEGMRPVVEIMWADFMLVALDQLINQAANVRYVSRSELTAPMVVRTQQGATPGSCAQHSQSLEALLAHVPGLKLGLPATAADAYAMLRSAIADPDPVILIEARSLYQVKGPVDRGAPVRRVGGARIRRTGGDLTVLTWGTAVPHALAAAEPLAERGIEIGVVDLRWLSPLDDDAIERAVRTGNGRVLVVHEANITGGFGAEIAARVQERHFDYLDQPIHRLGVPDSRIPSAPALQRALLPDADAICRAATAIVGGHMLALSETESA
jgi:2-oxoisovalerate dehydrogenase E1 component